jgi:hypothetical protein
MGSGRRFARELLEGIVAILNLGRELNLQQMSRSDTR